MPGLKLFVMLHVLMFTDHFSGPGRAFSLMFVCVRASIGVARKLLN